MEKLSCRVMGCKEDVYGALHIPIWKKDVDKKWKLFDYSTNEFHMCEEFIKQVLTQG